MATGNVPITPGSGALVRVVTNAGVDSGANQQVFSLADQFGNLAPADPDGTLQVSPEAVSLYIDDFSAALPATVYNASGTVAPSASGGLLTTSTSTTASSTSFVRTIGTFGLRTGSYLVYAALIRLESSALTNNSRWWGLGQNQGSPTAAAPVLNGAVFLVDYTNGGLYAATYSAGTRGVFTALTRPSDNAFHRYEIRYRQSIIYWLIDGLVVTTTTMPNLAVANNLYAIIGSANFTTSPSAGPSLAVSSQGVSDLSGTVKTLGDGAYPWLQATVKNGSLTAATTDNPLVIAHHPSTPLPAGSSVIGAIGIGATAPVTYSLTSAASTNAAVIKSSATALHSLTISNPTSTAAYVKLYNVNVAPTVGTTVPVITLRVAPTGSAGDLVVYNPGVMGQRFSSGLGIAITAAAAATDTAVTVAGIQVFGTYV